MDECTQMFQSYRKEFFKSICLEDVRQIIAFERIVRNYMKMDKALRESEE